MLNRFYIGHKMIVYADARLNNDVVAKLFHRFTYETSSLELKAGAALSFVIGDISVPDVPEGCEYSLVINNRGVAIAGKDHPALMRGFFSMLMKIEREMGKKELFLASVHEDKAYAINNRMIHLCVFPETTLLDVKKYVRLFALLQYTHVVIEFWGTLKYDACPSLAWDHAYTKNEIKEIIKEANLLGIEPIPMFNSLAHASQSRAFSGKHTILDNNLSLYHLFTPDGWAWDLENEDVWALLKSVRKELYELFEDCEYFHLGFDESHSHNANPALSARLSHYMSQLTREVQDEGKRPMIWMDMILPPDAFLGMQGNAHSVKSREDCIKIIRSLASNTVFVDWEYSVKHAPISSVLYYKDLGIDVMGAPWFGVENAHAHIDTVADHRLFGVMQTTWHTISSDLPNIIPIAKKLGAVLPTWEAESVPAMIVSTLLRYVTHGQADYPSLGWVRHQLP